MNTSVSRAIAQAKTQTSGDDFMAGIPAKETLPAPVAAAPPPGARSIDDKLAQRGLAISNWLGVTDSGIKINKMNPPHETLLVELIPSEVIPTTAIRWTTAGGTSFDKTFDGVKSAKSGMPWQETVEKAQAANTGAAAARPYESSDIPMTLLQEVKGKKANGEQVTLAAGSKVGFSTNWSSEQEFVAFLAQIVASHGKDVPVKVELGFAMRPYSTSTAVITWKVAD